MKATIDKKALAEALAFVGKCADRRGTMPVLGHVHIAAYGDSVVLTCTDLCVAGRYTIAGDGVVIDSIGEALVDVRLLAKVVAGVADTDVVLSTDGSAGWLHVKSGTDRTVRLQGLSPSDYPDVERLLPKSGPLIGTGAERLPNMRRVLHAASTDEARVNLNTVHLGDDATVATDGHRMAVAPGIGGGVARTVPLPLARLLVSLTDNAELWSDGEAVTCAADGPAMLGGKLSTTTFPPYRQVIPKREAARTVAQCDRRALLGVLRAAIDLAESKTRMVRLRFADGRVVVESRNEHGDLRDVVECTVTGPALDVGVNASYVVDGFAACEGETVELAMGGELDPIVISDGSGYSEVVMPVRG